jgi:8-oxo-dGTP pyrophosphatase MutT (NUDIX family)
MPEHPYRTTGGFHDETDRCGAGVLVYCLAVRKFLVGKRGPDCNQPLTWAPFGGMVEPGENILVAACRELWEEAKVGLRVDDLADLYCSEGTNGFKFYTFIAAVAEQPIVRINEESSDFLWLTPQEMADIGPKHPGFEALLLDEEVQRRIRLVTSL